MGRTFITLGVLILAFVAYQLWGTGIEFNSSQRALAKDFRRLEEQARTSTTIASTTITPTTAAVAPESTAQSGTTTAPDTPPSPTTAPGSSAAPNTSSGQPDVVGGVATAVKTDGIQLGDVVASIRMPTISRTTYYVVAGVRTQDLKRGVGHYPGTPLPGQFGNAALAGHRTTYGHPFENVDRLKPGDPILVDVADGNHYQYIVDSQEVIMPDNTEVLMQPSDPKQALLTLTTCHPKRSTKRRLVIHAHLDLGNSSAPSAQTANYVIIPPRPHHVGPSGPGTTMSGPVTTVAGSGSTAVSSTVPGTTAPLVSTSIASGPTSTSPTDSARDNRDLARGWFHDSSAWPQIALWGGLLVLISLGGWWVNRRTRRRWLGWVLAAAPFVVTLYFFFQNVNRLLPPGL